MTLFVEERRYNILLVEDEAVNINIILDCLGSKYQVYIAKTRAKAFVLLEREAIDLVLLDVNLPDGNGFDICREVIDDKERFGQVHIVFMTGMDSPEDEARGIKIGAVDYITKPINATVLLARVELQMKLIRQTELLSNLARIDGITEVHNRRAFDDRLAEEWNRAQREKASLSLCMVDIDYFKRFNDTYGHPEGDRCLKAVAQCLSQNFQRGSDFVARYGGEEFAVIISNADLIIAESMIERALTAVKKLAIKHDASEAANVVTFSAGVASLVPESGFSINDFVSTADAALYEAKAEGRAQVISRKFKSPLALSPT